MQKKLFTGSKIVIKLCAFYQKYGSFWGKKIVHLFVRFLTKLGAPLSSELLATLDSET